MVRIPFLSSILFILGLLFIFNCEKKQETIATVGKLIITSDDMIESLSRKYSNDNGFQKVDLEKKKELLDELIFEKLQINEATVLGLDTNETFKKDIKDRFENLMLYRYYEKFVVNHFVSEEEINEVLDKSSTEIKASHILIGYDDAKRKYNRPKAEAELLANFVAKQARSGEDFGTLVKNYSDDPKTVDKDGDLGYFKWGKMVDPFQQAAWKMKVGEISDPVESEFGYHIIRLDDRKELARKKLSYKDYYRAKERLFSKHIVESRKIADSLYNELQKKYSFQLKEEAVNQISEKIKNTVKNKFDLKREMFTDKERKMVLAEWDGGQMTLDLLIESLGYQARTTIRQLMNVSTFQYYIFRFSNSRLMIKDAYNLGYDKDPYVLDELERSRLYKLQRLYENKYIKKNFKVEESEIEAYYKDNPEEFKTKDNEIRPLDKVRREVRSKIWKNKQKANNDKHKALLMEKYSIQIDEKALAAL